LWYSIFVVHRGALSRPAAERDVVAIEIFLHDHLHQHKRPVNVDDQYATIAWVNSSTVLKWYKTAWEQYAAKVAVVSAGRSKDHRVLYLT
jgi:hypothetical protein